MDHLRGFTSHAVRYYQRADERSWDEDWREYVLGQQLTDGEGGTAMLFDIDDVYPRMVAKAYKDDAFNPDDIPFGPRVDVMARHNAMLTSRFHWATWPRRMLFRDKHATDPRRMLGYTMERLQLTRSLRDLLLDDNPHPRPTLSDAVHLAGALAEQVARLHAHAWEWVLVDLSPNNILIPRDYSRVILIDTDGFQFRDPLTGELYQSTHMTPGHKAPHSDSDIENGRPLTPAHDDFCVALLICMIFMWVSGACAHPFEHIAMTEDTDDLIRRKAFALDDPALKVSDRVRAAWQAIPDPIRLALGTTFRSDPLPCAAWSALLKDYRRSL